MVMEVRPLGISLRAAVVERRATLSREEHPRLGEQFGDVHASFTNLTLEGPPIGTLVHEQLIWALAA